MIKIETGSLNRIISIKSKTDVSDGMGGFTSTWGTRIGMGSVPAAIWPVKAVETEQSMAIVMNVSHQIRIRYRSGILPSDRVEYGTRNFDIVSIINKEEKNVFLDLMCKETR